MRQITINHNIILFNNCYSIQILNVLVCLLYTLKLTILLTSMKLLCLNYVSTLYLRIFYLYLRIIEYEIVVVDILNFDRLILIFLFRFWGSTSSSMWSIYSYIHVLIRVSYIHSILIQNILLIHKIFKVLIIIWLICLLSLMTIVSRKLIISKNTISSLKCFIFSFLCTKFFFFYQWLLFII